MKRFGAIVAIFALSGGLALAQGSGGTSGGTGGGTSASPGASTTSPTGPGTTKPPAVNPPSPADNATTGRAPGVNPSNSQDLSRRNNPQDMTLPGAKNPQDLKR